MPKIGRTGPWTNMKLQGNRGSEQRREDRVRARRHAGAAVAAIGRAIARVASHQADAAACSNGPTARKLRSALGIDAETSHILPASSARHHRTAKTP